MITKLKSNTNQCFSYTEKRGNIFFCSKTILRHGHVMQTTSSSLDINSKLGAESSLK